MVDSYFYFHFYKGSPPDALMLIRLSYRGSADGVGVGAHRGKVFMYFGHFPPLYLCIGGGGGGGVKWHFLPFQTKMHHKEPFSLLQTAFWGILHKRIIQIWPSVRGGGSSGWGGGGGGTADGAPPPHNAKPC